MTPTDAEDENYCLPSHRKKRLTKFDVPPEQCRGSKERNSQQNEKKKKPVNNRCKASSSDKSTVQK